MQALKESLTPDTVLNERRIQIKRSKEYISELSHKVKENANAVEKEIYRLLEVAVKTNAALAQQKIRQLQSVENDLLRDMFTLEWTERYLRDQRNSLPPAGFLKLWNQHVELRKSQYDFTYRPPESLVEDVTPDIRVQGSIAVTTSDVQFLYKARQMDAQSDAASSEEVSPRTRKFLNVVLDEKQDSSSGLTKSPGNTVTADPESPLSTEDMQLLSQATVLSSIGTDPQELNVFKRKLEVARRGAQRSVQRTALVPNTFSSVADASSATVTPVKTRIHSRNRRNDPNEEPGMIAISDVVIQQTLRMSFIASQRAQESPALIDDMYV